MFCNYCGSLNPDDAKYCNKCGHAVVRPPAPQQPKIPNVKSFPPDDQLTQKSVGDIGNEFSDTYSNMLDDELLHLAEKKESLTDVARDALAAELRKRGLSLRSSEQDTQPLQLGYGWGFAYALAFAGLASIQLFQSIAELSAATPSSLGAYQQSYYATRVGLSFLVLLGSFAISRKHRSTLGIVYAFAALHAVGVLLRGVTPSDLAIWLVIQFPSIRYFRRRKESFKRQAIREADSPGRRLVQ